MDFCRGHALIRGGTIAIYTLGFLINVQALLSVQGGEMPLKNNRAGPNKSAGGKNCH